MAQLTSANLRAPMSGEIELTAIPPVSSLSSFHTATSPPGDGGETQTRLRKFLVLLTICAVPFLSSMLSGLLTVGLPVIATELELTENLLLWPASVYALACGCSLLLFGSVADVLGTRKVYLVGCAVLALSTLACALSQTGIQLIMFRAVSGLAISCCLPCTVSIVTNTFKGRTQNIAFACLGAAQPVGFSLGLIVGGILVDTVGWRYGFYGGFGTNLIMGVSALFAIPKTAQVHEHSAWKQLATQIDWVGNLLASAAMGLLSYVLAMVTSSSTDIGEPQNIVLLCTAATLIVCFAFWMKRQEKHNLPAVMPNSLWSNNVFTTVCIAIFMAWSTLNAFQFFAALYFQKVENLSASQTSLRLVPMAIGGSITNVITGFLVPRVSANILVLVTAAATSLSSLLMAINDPTWPYWYMAFAATLFSSINADVLFTVGNLVITSVFPPKTHALAGGVFNTVSQIGNSVGLAIGAVIASSVTMGSDDQSKGTGAALLKGYRATFWACFGTTLSMMLVSVWGLRTIGKVGLKRE